MAFQGELHGLDGAKCECGEVLILDVQMSNGYYLGYFCGRCGPFSRETGYYATRNEAQAELDEYVAERIIPTLIRHTDYTGY